jgi:PAS domain S-box-containing protein
VATIPRQLHVIRSRLQSLSDSLQGRPVARHGIALLLALVATLATTALEPFVASTRFVFFFPAVVLAAWLGGTSPAVVVGAIAVIATDLSLAGGGLSQADPELLVPLGLFAATAVLAGHVADAERRARHEISGAAEHQARTNTQLEEQAAEMEVTLEEQQALTEELADANARLDAESRESRRATAALAENEERLRLALDAGRLGTWEWRINEDVVTWSDALRLIHGGPHVTIPATSGAAAALIHPDDRPGVQEARASARDGTAYHVQYRIVRSDGAVRWLDERGKLQRDDSGRAIRLVGVAADVTESRRRDDALQLLADASDMLGRSLDHEITLRNVATLSVPILADWCAVDLKDADGSIRRVALAHPDPAMVRLARELDARYPADPDGPSGARTVMRSGQTLVMRDIPDQLLVDTALDADHLQILRRLGLRSAVTVPLVARGEALGVITFAAAESGRRFTDEDVAVAEDVARRAAQAIDNGRLVRKQVEARTRMEQQAAALEVQSEELSSAQEELEVINEELRQANEQLVLETEAANRARLEAEAGNRAKSEFLAMMSHELRTPLNAIAGYADLLEMEIRGPVTDAQREDLQRIRRSQQHLLALINDVLNFAKLEAGHVHFDVRPTAVHPVLAELESLIMPQLMERQITYRYDACDPALDAMADPEKLRQVLLNLLSNGIKFTLPGGRIELSCQADPHVVLIHVEDTGAGIAREQQERIFEPFVQLARTYTDRTHGTGLGLAISRDLARRMGGDLTLHSVPGTGSRFTLSLPRAAVPATLPPLAQERPLLST